MPSFLSAPPERNSWTSLSDDDFWACVRLAPVVQAWINGIQAEALRRGLSGEDLTGTGMKLVSKIAHRKWLSTPEVIEVFSSAGLREDEFMTQPELQSPSQLERKFRRNPIWAEVQSYIEKPRGSPTLAPVSDRRPEWVPTSEFNEE
jgi:hypothetical protein